MYDSFRSVARFRSVDLDPVSRRLGKTATIEDLRRVAKRRLPAGVFDYFDGGAEDERTLAANAAGFAKWEFCPNVLVDVSELDISTTLFGRPVAMPLMLAPTGYSRLACSPGELAVARPAARAGVPYSLSTMSTRSIEEVAAVSDGPKWFQVYTWKDRSLVEELVGRAAAAGYEGLWLTVDTAVLGRRERDVRRGYTIPPTIGLDTIIEGIRHPSWTWDFLTHEPIVFANVVGRPGADRSEGVALAVHVMDQFDQKLSWDDLDWLRSIWDGPIMLKGIQTVDDARRATAAGIEGIGLSNHGGRQLDDAPAPIDLVEPVAQELQGAATIIVDGGVRRGSDIVKAIALGANGVSIGRPYLYGLGAAGERGVDHVLRFFADGLARTMALCGRTRVSDIDRGLVRRRT